MIRVLTCCALFALAACDDGRLMNVRSDDGADEFAILPGKPLRQPESFASLPPPTPGAANRTDPTPRSDAIAALGGVPGAGVAGGDVVAYASRYGRDPRIREELAEADAAFRARNQGRFLERVFNVNVYYEAYEPFALDQRREAERFRRAGVPTPVATPAE